MSISPVQSFDPVPGELTNAQPGTQARPPHPYVPPPASDTPQTYPPDSGGASKQEVVSQSATAPASQEPEDEVQLQHDSELENQLIVRYVDKAGDVVLQVPSAQLLNFEQVIAAEFQKPAVAPKPEPSGQEGESHGH